MKSGDVRARLPPVVSLASTKELVYYNLIRLRIHFSNSLFFVTPSRHIYSRAGLLVFVYCQVFSFNLKLGQKGKYTYFVEIILPIAKFFFHFKILLKRWIYVVSIVKVMIIQWMFVNVKFNNTDICNTAYYGERVESKKGTL